jgi:hypothetical protein
MSASLPRPAAPAQDETRSVLAIPAFRKLWNSMVFSSLGDWLGLLATTALAQELSGGSYATAKNNMSSQVNIKGTQLGARYLLSKRTDLYVITGSNKITKSDSSANYVTQSGAVFGVRHQF